MAHDYDLDEDYDEDRYSRPDEDWPHSGIGVASFIIGLVVVLLILAAFGLIAMAAVQTPNSRNPPVGVMVGGMVIIGAGILALAGIGLGIGGVCQRDRKKVFGIIGLCINGLVLLGGIAVVLLGLIVKSTH